MRHLISVQLARVWAHDHPPAWLDLAQRLVASLREDDPAAEIRIVADPALTASLAQALPDATITPVDWSAVAARAGLPRRDLTARLRRDDADAALVQDVANATLAALDGYAPDFRFTVDVDPVLDQLFAQTPKLHLAAGPFRGAPTPSTAALDPFGAGRAAAPARFTNEIAAKKRSPLDQDFVDMLRDRLSARIAGASDPLTSLLEDARRGARKLVVALLDEDPIIRWGDAAPQTPFEFVDGLLRGLPRDVLLAAPSLGRPLFDAAELEILKREHPHFVADAAFSAVADPSLFLVAEADAVIGFDDARVLQALLWRKPLITPPDSVWKAHADATVTTALQSVMESGARAPGADAALAWLLTRYFLPSDLLFEPKSLRGRLENAASEEVTASGVNWFYRAASSGQLDSAYRIGAAGDALRANGRVADDTLVLTLRPSGAETASATTRLFRPTLSPKAVTLPAPAGGEVSGLRLGIDGHWAAILLHSVEVLDEQGGAISRWSLKTASADAIGGTVAIPAEQLDAALVERAGGPVWVDLDCPGAAHAVRVVASAASPRTVQECRTAHWRDMAAIGARHENALAGLSHSVDTLSKAAGDSGARFSEYTEQVVDRLSEIESGLVESIRGARQELEGSLLQRIAESLETRNAVMHADIEAGMRPVLERVANLEAALAGALHALRNDMQFVLADQIASAIDAQFKSIERLSGPQQNGEESRALITRVGELDRKLSGSLDLLRADIGANIAQRISTELDDRMRAIAMTMVENFRSLNARLGLTGGDIGDEPTLTGAVAAIETRLAERLKAFAAEFTGLNAAEQRISLKLDEILQGHNQSAQLIETSLERNTAMVRSISGAVQATADGVTTLSLSLETLSADVASIAGAEQRLSIKLDDVQRDHAQALQVFEAGMERSAALARTVSSAVLATADRVTSLSGGLENLAADIALIAGAEQRLTIKLDDVQRDHAQALQVFEAGMERSSALARTVSGAVMATADRVTALSGNLESLAADIASIAGAEQRLTIKLDEIERHHANSVQVFEAGVERHAATANNVYRRLSHSETILLDIKNGAGAPAMVDALRRDLSEASRHRDEAMQMAERWRQEADALRQSTSWRITAPLRGAILATRSLGAAARPAKA